MKNIVSIFWCAYLSFYNRLIFQLKQILVQILMSFYKFSFWNSCILYKILIDSKGSVFLVFRVYIMQSFFHNLCIDTLELCCILFWDIHTHLPLQFLLVFWTKTWATRHSCSIKKLYGWGHRKEEAYSMQWSTHFGLALFCSTIPLFNWYIENGY